LYVAQSVMGSTIVVLLVPQRPARQITASPSPALKQ
jgi:hypothetical protein